MICTLQKTPIASTHREVRRGWEWFGQPTEDELRLIKGKYLFFSENRNHLCHIALNEMNAHKFKLAKVSIIPNENGEHVLCIYDQDSSLKHDLAVTSYYNYGLQSFGDSYCESRGLKEYQGPFLGKYRWWKSNEDTANGVYSEQHRKLLLQMCPNGVPAIVATTRKRIVPHTPPQGFKKLHPKGTIYAVSGPNHEIFYIGYTSKTIEERRSSHLSACLDEKYIWNEGSPKPFALLLSNLRKNNTAELLSFQKTTPAQQVTTTPIGKNTSQNTN